MAKSKGSYETMLVLSTSLGDEGISALIEKFKNLISKNGSIDSVDEWGKRRLAYPIKMTVNNQTKDETEGYYYLINFTCEPSFVAELDRIYNITDGVMRTLIISTDNI